MNKNKFYITAAIPYVNAKPHIGHALEFIQTDTIARYHRIIGEEVLALSGGDENAVKNVQAAEKVNIPLRQFIDQNTQLFYELTKKLDVQFDVWQKGSDEKTHFPSSQELWKRCATNGDIYKESYSGLYCVGCEAFYAPDELDQNRECFEHPGKKLEVIKEENYFFRLSKYQNLITELIEGGKLAIIPEARKNETLSFVKSGLKDISISRSNERARSWGVPVPGDDKQRIYVWFDALNIYQSGVGFGWNDDRYQKWWPADVHVIGKGIIRFHAVYWIAFLLSAQLSLPKKIFVHGYFTVNGQKMSKTLGNVYDPIPLIEKYGADALRYYCLAKFSPFEDGDFSEEKFKETYNSDLANGLGNLVARVAKLCERLEMHFVNPLTEFTGEEFVQIKNALEKFQLDEAVKEIWRWISKADRRIEATQPWKLSGKELEDVLIPLAYEIQKIAVALQPFMPETAQRILKQFGSDTIKPELPLFPRIV